MVIFFSFFFSCTHHLYICLLIWYVFSKEEVHLETPTPTPTPTQTQTAILLETVLLEVKLVLVCRPLSAVVEQEEVFGENVFFTSFILFHFFFASPGPSNIRCCFSRSSVRSSSDVLSLDSAVRNANSDVNSSGLTEAQTIGVGVVAGVVGTLVVVLIVVFIVKKRQQVSKF